MSGGHGHDDKPAVTVAAGSKSSLTGIYRLGGIFIGGSIILVGLTMCVAMQKSPQHAAPTTTSAGQQPQVAQAQQAQSPAQTQTPQQAQTTAGPDCPTEKTVDNSPAPVGMMHITAPIVTDPSNPEADANWTPYVRGHPGKTLSSPEFPSPGIRVEYVNMYTCQVDSGAADYMSAARFQSTTGQPIPMRYGYTSK